MNQPKSRLITLLGLGLGLITLILLTVINSGIARLVEWIHPGAGFWAHLALAVIEALAFLWFWRGVFGRHQHLLALNNPDTEEQREFAEELTRRMKRNTHIRACMERHPSELDADDPGYLEHCLFILGQQADDEIRHTAKRIFLATALSQNGRIDALIVFASLCRLVWRISAIYNQRPHPREIISLYGAVVSSTFLALSLEELDIGTEITVGFGEAFNAMAPASLTASIPFAGKALQTFTSSSIDGAANCYLALRAGIITRNAYMYGHKPGGWPSRALVYKEAGGMLLGMSQELVGRVASAVGAKLGGLARQAQNRTVQVGKDIAGSMNAGAEKIVDGTIYAVKGTGQGIKKAGVYSGSAVSRAARLGARTAIWPFRMAVKPFRRKRTREKKE